MTPLAGLRSNLLYLIRSQGFSIMFSTTTAPPGGSRGQEDKEDEEEGIEEEDEEGEEENGTSFAPWGAANPTGNPSGNRGAAGGGGGGNWQGSGSSLSWLTNLRKGIMSGGRLSFCVGRMSLLPVRLSFHQANLSRCAPRSKS